MGVVDRLAINAMQLRPSAASGVVLVLPPFPQKPPAVGKIWPPPVLGNWKNASLVGGMSRARADC